MSIGAESARKSETPIESKTRLPVRPRSKRPDATARTIWTSLSAAEFPNPSITWIWTCPPERVETSRTNSPAAGAETNKLKLTLAIRSVTCPGAPPALLPVAGSVHPATPTTRASTKKAGHLRLMSRLGQGDLELEQGAIPPKRENLTV